jgi:hypothetical protein
MVTLKSVVKHILTQVIEDFVLVYVDRARAIGL